MELKDIATVIAFILVCQMAGIIGSVFTIDGIEGWYDTLVKPDITPPNWVFGPVWTLLYAMMGISAFLVYKSGIEKKENKIALGIFLFQLVLNTLWSIVFFGMNSLGGALAIIAILWISIVATIISFYKISRVAAGLLIPYLLWVTFASILNYLLFSLN
jgi:tryptophan-rich sensory protein